MASRTKPSVVCPSFRELLAKGFFRSASPLDALAGRLYNQKWTRGQSPAFARSRGGAAR
ncbi:hypothetical protein THTE_3122 [Thermogutta terrifontis]|uniref:Uncharacterized protein n=1 Tax=Thermogutta terrifontis TaxID=1331910 RepID=A0A286RID8_9BACT|nr:hypothetical protein THTE_3122 [Thermogutta terrifontis]